MFGSLQPTTKQGQSCRHSNRPSGKKRISDLARYGLIRSVSLIDSRNLMSQLIRPDDGQIVVGAEPINWSACHHPGRTWRYTTSAVFRVGLILSDMARRHITPYIYTLQLARNPGNSQLSTMKMKINAFKSLRTSLRRRTLHRDGSRVEDTAQTRHGIEGTHRKEEGGRGQGTAHGHLTAVPLQCVRAMSAPVVCTCV